METDQTAMDAEKLLEFRNRNLGSMFCSEFAADYLHILCTLLDFRRRHELEILREDLFQTALENYPRSGEKELPDSARFNQVMQQLENWNIVVKRIEKTRIRSYRDVRRDMFRYRLTDETIAFLNWLEERHASDLLPKEDDSVNLQEFILGSIKQIGRNLRDSESRYSAVIFALGDVEEKTARLSRNLNQITIRLGEFLLKSYTPEEARETVNGLDVYFKHYLQQLFKLRSGILKELEQLNTGSHPEQLRRCEELFEAEQRTRPQFMRTGGLRTEIRKFPERLLEYYGRGGHVDKLCSSVHENAMKVLGKLTSFLKELERRSNRLEFINLRLLELAGKPESFEAPEFLRELLTPAAAPLDMNDADEFQKAEPPAPRFGSGGRRIPPRIFSRTVKLSEKQVETHEEMRLRQLAEFLKLRYPENGPLEQGQLERGDLAEVGMLLKYGLTGEGRMLMSIGKKLEIHPAGKSLIRFPEGALEGPQTILKETGPNGN